MKGFLCQ